MRRTVLGKAAIGLAAFVLLAVFASGALADDPPPSGSGSGASPAVSTDKSSYQPGDTVLVTGAGWLPGESVHVHAAAGSNPFTYDTDVLAAADGSIDASFALPSEYADTFAVAASSPLQGSVSTSFSDAFAAAASPPTVISDKADYRPGETVTLAGAGWQPDESVNLFVNDDEGQIWSYTTSAVADSSGSFTVAFQLPNTFIASYKVVATGSTSGSVSTSFTDSNIGLSPTTGPVGTTVTISSANFNKNKTVTATFNGAAVTLTPSPCTTDNNGNFSCTFVVPSIAAGTYQVTATDGSGPTSANFTVTGKQDQAPLSVTAPSAGTFGQTLQITSSGGSGTGAVTYSVGSSTACAINGSDATKLDITAGTGTCAVTATKAGDANFNPATSPAHTVTVSKANQSITVTTSAPSSAGFNSIFTVAATASSGLAVAYTSSGSCSNSAGLFTMTSGTGTCTVNFDQAGNGNYNAATRVTQSVTATKASQSITFAALPDKTFGDAPFTVSATGGASGNPVTFAATGNCSNSGSTVTITGAGSCTVTASQAGNGNYNAAADVPRSFSIAKASQSITFAALPNKTFGDAPFTVSATGGASGNPVTFAAAGNCSNSGSTVTITGAGSCTVTASQAGNGNYNAAGDVARSFSIGKASQLITFAALPDKTFGDAPFTVSATGGASGNPVTFAATGNCSSSGSTVTITGAGSCTVTASQAGNGNYNAAADVARSFSIGKASQLITFAALPDKTFGDAPFTVSATGGASGNPVTFAATGNCSSSGSTVTITGAGSCTVTASQAGNGNYNAATDVARSFSIAKADQAIAFGPLAGKTYGDAPFTVSATGGGSGNPVTFSVGSLDNCTSSGSTITITGAGSCTVTASQAGNDNYNPAVSVSQPFLIARAVLTVTASDATKVYGDPNPAFTAGYSGFVNGDTASVLSGSPSLSSAATPASGVGAYPIDASTGTLSAANYSFTFKSGSLSVTKATLTVTADDKSREYGDADPAFTASYTGFVNGDTESVLSGSPGLSTPATASSPVGSYAITAVTGSLSAANYSFTFKAGSLSVTRATLTVTADNKARQYGDANPAFTASISGFKNDETLDTSGVTGSADCASSADAGSSVNGSPYAITCSIGSLAAGNYLFSLAPGQLTVTRAPLAVTADDLSREYGDANPAPTVKYAGFKNGETLASSDVTGAPACVVNANAASPVSGNPYFITCSVGSLTSGNYDFGFVSGSLTITKAPLSAKADDATKVYGDANPTFTGSLTGVKNADAVTLTFSTAADGSSNVGSYDVVPVVGGAADVLANYRAPVLTNGTLTVTKAPLVVTADDKSREYGDANPVFTHKTTGFRLGQGESVLGTVPSCDSAVTAASSVAAGPYAVVCSGGVDSNYSFSYTDGKLTLTRAPLTVTAADKAKVYGDPNPALTGTMVGVKNGDPIAENYSTTADLASNVGSYTITATPSSSPAALLDNYLVTVNNGTLQVTKAPLVVTADDKSREYGDANPAFTHKTTGFRLGQGESVLGTVPSCDSAVTAASSVAAGPYAVVCSGGVDSNYSFSYTDGKLTLTRAPLTVTAADKAKVYGDPNPALTGTMVGVKNGDPIAENYSTTADLASNVGSYTITATPSSSPAALLDNYLVTVNNGTLQVTKAPLVVTADDKSREYGDANPAFTHKTTGFRLGQGESVLGTVPSCDSAVTAASSVAAGPYAVVCSGGVDSNYSFSYTDGKLTLTRAPLTVTAADKAKVYGDPNPALTGTMVGVKNGDPIAENYSTTADLASNVGSYTITATPSSSPAALLDNYLVTVNHGTLQVTKAPLVVTADDKSREYGDANPAFTHKTTGFRLGQGESVLGTVPSCDSAVTAASSVAAGPYAVVCSGGVDSNYSFSYTDGKLTLTRAPLTAKADDATKVYGDANPTFTGSLTGVKNSDPVTLTFSTAANAASGVGAYNIVPVVNGAPAVLANYQAPALTSGTLTVTKAPLSAKADDKSKVYGDANPTFTGSLTGVKNSDPVTLTFSTAANAASGVGAYNIVPVVNGAPAVLANYQAPALTSGTLTVTKAPLSAKADDKSKVYGDANPTFTGSLTGVKNSDPVTLTFSTAANAASGVGAYGIAPVINAAAAVLANYQAPALTNGTLTVTKAPLSAKADDKAKLLNAANPTFTGAVTGIKNSDPITLTFTTTATQTSPVGTYPIVPVINATDAVLANYQAPVLTNGTLTVTYRLDGYLQPINDTAHTGLLESKFKLGQTIPAKFQLKDALGNVVQQVGNPTFSKTYLGASCGQSVPDTTDTVTPDPGSVFTWDGSQYHYNWSTKGLAGGEYRITATLADGEKVPVNICLS